MTQPLFIPQRKKFNSTAVCWGDHASLLQHWVHGHTGFTAGAGAQESTVKAMTCREHLKTQSHTDKEGNRPGGDNTSYSVLFNWGKCLHQWLFGGRTKRRPNWLMPPTAAICVERWRNINCTVNFCIMEINPLICTVGSQITPSNAQINLTFWEADIAPLRTGSSSISHLTERG